MIAQIISYLLNGQFFVCLFGFFLIKGLYTKSNSKLSTVPLNSATTEGLVTDQIDAALVTRLHFSWSINSPRNDNKPHILSIGDAFGLSFNNYCFAWLIFQWDKFHNVTTCNEFLIHHYSLANKRFIRQIITTIIRKWKVCSSIKKYFLIKNIFPLLQPYCMFCQSDRNGKLSVSFLSFYNDIQQSMTFLIRQVI